MGRFDGKTAVITGGSRGIGFELARLCAAEGAGVILVSRTAGDLEQAVERIAAERAGIPVRAIPADLSRDGGAQELWRALASEGVQVDILINNAGFGMFGRYQDLDQQTEQEMIELNVASLTQLSRLAVPGMLQRRWGRIMNVASTAGFQSVPYFASYAATKAYVLSYSVALWGELRGSGVAVTCLSPGPTKTDFFRVARMQPSRRAGMLPAAAVAKAGMKAMIKGRPLVVAGLVNKLVAQFSRFLPRRVVALAAGAAMGHQLP